MRIQLILPMRGRIDRLTRFISNADGRERLRVESFDPDLRHEPPSITEILEAAGVSLTPPDGPVTMTALEDLSGGRSQLVEIECSQTVAQAITQWHEARDYAAIRQETAVIYARNVRGSVRARALAMASSAPAVPEGGPELVDLRPEVTDDDA